MEEREIATRVRGLFGFRLLGLFAFGSRVLGTARPDSDLDLGVWLRGPLRRADTWLPWAKELGEGEPHLDPTFFTAQSLAEPPGWLLEAARGGTRILFDPDGELDRALAQLRDGIVQGRHRRRLFMGLPFYESGLR